MLTRTALLNYDSSEIPKRGQARLFRDNLLLLTNLHSSLTWVPLFDRVKSDQLVEVDYPVKTLRIENQDGVLDPVVIATSIGGEIFEFTKDNLSRVNLEEIILDFEEDFVGVVSVYSKSKNLDSKSFSLYNKANKRLIDPDSITILDPMSLTGEEYRNSGYFPYFKSTSNGVLHSYRTSCDKDKSVLPETEVNESYFQPAFSISACDGSEPVFDKCPNDYLNSEFTSSLPENSFFTDSPSCVLPSVDPSDGGDPPAFPEYAKEDYYRHYVTETLDPNQNVDFSSYLANGIVGQESISSDLVYGKDPSGKITWFKPEVEFKPSSDLVVIPKSGALSNSVLNYSFGFSNPDTKLTERLDDLLTLSFNLFTLSEDANSYVEEGCDLTEEVMEEYEHITISRPDDPEIIIPEEKGCAWKPPVEDPTWPENTLSSLYEYSVLEQNKDFLSPTKDFIDYSEIIEESDWHNSDVSSSDNCSYGTLIKLRKFVKRIVFTPVRDNRVANIPLDMNFDLENGDVLLAEVGDSPSMLAVLRENNTVSVFDLSEFEENDPLYVSMNISMVIDTPKEESRLIKIEK